MNYLKRINEIKGYDVNSKNSFLNPCETRAKAKYTKLPYTASEHRAS